MTRRDRIGLRVLLALNPTTTQRPERTPALDHVLALVRDTGKSAHPRQGERISDVVMAVSVVRGLNPVELQAEVEAWGDYIRAAVRFEG